jgi:hypothetical protein
MSRIANRSLRPVLELNHDPAWPEEAFGPVSLLREVIPQRPSALVRPDGGAQGGHAVEPRIDSSPERNQARLDLSCALHISRSGNFFLLVALSARYR